MPSFMGLSGPRSSSGVVEVERFLTPELKSRFEEIGISLKTELAK